ncbi:MAG: hypothetical protein QOJ64_3205 [Acidobacteriota bacterium]|jgi:hypothetical protein|nr:hypothetical protein [Acidobacteriota bacterium]
MKLFRYFVITIFVATSSSTFVFAQTPACSRKEAPEFNGFRTGMAVSDVKNNLADPSVMELKTAAVNKIGVQQMKVLGTELKDEYAEGIDDIQLTFLDRRLVVIKATYNSGMTWMGSQDFFKQTSQKLGLPNPPTPTSSRGGGNEKYTVECAGFAAILAYSFGVSPNVTIYDTVAHKDIEARALKNPDGEVKTINMTPTRRPPRPNPPFQTRQTGNK